MAKRTTFFRQYTVLGNYAIIMLARIYEGVI